jgi:hypothetical protein
MYCTLQYVGAGDSVYVQGLLKLLQDPSGCTNAHIADWISLDVIKRDPLHEGAA